MASLEETLGPLRAGRNIVYFAEEVLGVRLNPAQKRWFWLLAQCPDGWSWLYRRVIHVAANQIGKTLGLAIAILWAAHNKIGTNNAGWDYWLNSPYKWYHLAPSQGQADLTRADMVLLIKGIHPAQYIKETGERRPFRWLEGLATEVKFDKYYPGILLWNGAQVHFRTTEDKASAIQGVRANGASIDEPAFEDHLKQVMEEAVKLRLISTGGPLWLCGTPNGINDYFEVVSEILDVAVNTIHPRVWEAPKERLALVWSHIQDNVGYGLTQEQVDFMEGDVDSTTKEQQLRGAFITSLDAFFVPQEKVLLAFQAGMPEEREPEVGHKYVAFWDPSISSDPTVLIVLDVTKPTWIGAYFQRWEKPMSSRDLYQEMWAVHKKWNGVRTRLGRSQCITGFDATSMGGAIIKSELQRMSPRRPVNFAGHVKMDALTNLRAAFFSHLKLPASWIRVRREVLSYRLDDKKLIQDCVMALAGATYVARTGKPGSPTRPFDPGYTSLAWSN